MNRLQWESRLDQLEVEMLLARGALVPALDRAASLLESVRHQGMRKREGSLLRLVGEAHLAGRDLLEFERRMP